MAFSARRGVGRHSADDRECAGQNDEDGPHALQDFDWMGQVIGGGAIFSRPVVLL